MALCLEVYYRKMLHWLLHPERIIFLLVNEELYANPYFEVIPFGVSYQPLLRSAFSKSQEPSSAVVYIKVLIADYLETSRVTLLRYIYRPAEENLPATEPPLTI